MELTYQVISKTNFNESHGKILADFLTQQGKIHGDLTTKLNRCFFLCIAYSDNQPVAIAALKKPTKRAFAKAGLDSKDFHVTYELGYVYVSEAARGQGVSKELVAKLIQKSPDRQIMAITEVTTNIPMVKTLERYGFTKVGENWDGIRAETALGLMIKKETE